MTEKIQFVFTQGDPVDSVVALEQNSDTPLHQADSNHPNWDLIVEGLRNNDPDVFALFDPLKTAANKLMVLSERITYDRGVIRFDGEVQTGPLADHLVRTIKAGAEDYAPVVRFWELVETNPSQDSREALFRWLAKHEFAIDTDGYIVGYKSVVDAHKVDDDGDPIYASTRSGHAFVDGVEYNGTIEYKVGSVVSMPRSEVDNNGEKSCSSGLHVGDWSYAKNFTGSVEVEVSVNPRDVVSIPNDDSRKMRCCRFEVVKVIAPSEVPDKSPIQFKGDAVNVEAAKGYVPFG